tara:strand:- start:863 stop:1255 length:393 start_codon:yes stop_codon:yes gene_type:complete
MMDDLFDRWGEEEMLMTFEEYQEEAANTAIYPGALIYPMLGLQGEIGELSEKLKKYFRDTVQEMDLQDPVIEMSPELREDMAAECGDLLWYLTAVVNDLGFDLEEVAAMNLKKLKSRAARGQLQGSGDNR